jgi:hypothetical protein
MLTRNQHGYAKCDQRCTQRTPKRRNYDLVVRPSRARAHRDAEQLHEGYVDQKMFFLKV